MKWQGKCIGIDNENYIANIYSNPLIMVMETITNEKNNGIDINTN